MNKTKTIRVKCDDAFIIEQSSRELAAELQKEISVSDFMTELVKHAEKTKEDYKNGAVKTSKENKN
jgi:hypothetical protein